jgi:hypothetical protein
VLSKEGRRISAKSIGNTLMSARDRVSGGRHIELVSESSKTANTYKIVSTPEPKEAPEPEDEVM